MITASSKRRIQAILNGSYTVSLRLYHLNSFTIEIDGNTIKINTITLGVCNRNIKATWTTIE